MRKSHSLRCREGEGGVELFPAFASGDESVDMGDTAPKSRSRDGDEIGFNGSQGDCDLTMGSAVWILP